MWWVTLTVSVTILQHVQLTAGRARCETFVGSLVRPERAVSSRLGLRCEGLSEILLMLEKIPAFPKRYVLTR